MTKCNPAPTPGTAANKSTFADSEPFTPDQHKVYRRVVGKLQWLSFTRPDMSYSTKELARGLHQLTEADWKKAKHLLRYLRGTSNYTQQLRPTTTLSTSKAVLDMDVHADADWAGCPSTLEHDSFRNLHSRHARDLWFPNASYDSTQLSRKRTLRNLHRHK